MTRIRRVRNSHCGKESRMRIARTRTDDGFTLLELLIVLAIMMVVAAMATPNIWNAIANYRLREAASSLSGLAQSARSNSVRGNTAVALRWDTDNNRQRIYVDLNGNGSYDSGTEYKNVVLLPAKLQITAASHPGNAATGLWNTTTYTVTDNAFPRFNPRGLPCAVPAGLVVCSSLQPYVVYLKSDNAFGGTSWAAVTITPAGRIKSWIYQGNKYR